MKRMTLSMIAVFCTLCAMQAQQAATYTLKSCLEQGLFNNYSLRITHNEEQISKNNATLANAGALPTIDLTGSYRTTVDNTNSTVRSTGVTEKQHNVFDQTVDAGIDLNWTIFDGFNISTTYQQLKLKPSKMEKPIHASRWKTSSLH